MPAARSARSAWDGAIEFGGFPVHVRAFNLVQSRSAQSFKSLCACHQQPVQMPKRCPVDDTPLDPTQLLKGHQVSKDQIVVVPPEAAEKIRSVESTPMLKIEQLSPLASIDLSVVTGAFQLVPNEKVPGSEQPVQIIWNGLFASKRAIVTDWTPRAGSRDSLLVIHADAFGLRANTLPYKSELRSAPEFKPVENEQAAAMFEQFAASSGIDMDDFRYGDYESKYEQRRQAAIEAALSGKPVEIPDAAAPQAAVPDLMALMAASLADAGKPAKKAKAKAKDKVAA